MQTADFDHHAFEQNAQSEEDKKLLVKFFMQPRPDKLATVKEGRPIFKDVEYVDIKIPGDRTGGACRPATYQDKIRFSDHYRMFKARIEVPLEGTPLGEWPLITRSLVEELAFHNVKTVEHLAGMADVNIAKFMGLGTLKAKAVTWLETASEESKVHKLQDELAERDERIAALEAKVDQILSAGSAALVQPVESSGKDPDTPSEPPALDMQSSPPVKKKTPARRRKRVRKDGAVQDSK